MVKVRDILHRVPTRLPAPWHWPIKVAALLPRVKGLRARWYIGGIYPSNAEDCGWQQKSLSSRVNYISNWGFVYW